MQKSIFFSLLLPVFLAINADPLNNSKTLSTSAKSHQNPLPLQACLLKKCQKQTLETTHYLIEFLGVLTESIAYWNQQKLTPWRYFFVRGPYVWFGSEKQSTEIENKLNFLHQEHDRLAYYLGRLSYNEQHFNDHLNNDIFKILSEQFILIENVLMHKAIADNVFIDVLTPQDLLIIHDKNQDNLASFSPDFYKTISDYRIPGHIRRYWIPYTTAALGALAASIYVYNNPDKVQSFANDCIQYTKNFLATRVILPVQKAYQALFQNNKNSLTSDELDSIDFVTKEGFDETTRSTSESIKQYVQQYHKDLSTEQQDKIIQDAIKNGDSRLLNDDHIQEIKHSILNMFVGKLGKEYDLQFKLTKLNLNKALYVLSETVRKYKKVLETEFEAHSITRAVSLIGPLMVVLFGSIYAGKKFISCFIPVDTTNKKIQKVMHTIHHIVNTTTPTIPSDRIHINNGLIIYWTTQLKQLAHRINLESRQSLINDSTILASFDLSRDQKISTIEQMYRNYQFLKIV